MLSLPSLQASEPTRKVSGLIFGRRPNRNTPDALTSEFTSRAHEQSARRSRLQFQACLKRNCGAKTMHGGYATIQMAFKLQGTVAELKYNVGKCE